MGLERKYRKQISISLRNRRTCKKTCDENQAKKAHEEFSFDDNYESQYKKENPVEHAIMVKASEADDSRLVG